MTVVLMVNYDHIVNLYIIFERLNAMRLRSQASFNLHSGQVVITK